MAGLVVDASVTLSWALVGEAKAPEARAVADRIAENAAIVPAIWRLEVGNALLVAERRGRLTAAQAEAVCIGLAAMPIEIDPETSARAWADTARLARNHGLMLYDAAYLELAVRRALPLAMFDWALARAAVTESVPLTTGDY